jgi:GAF domain-containing protein
VSKSDDLKNKIDELDSTKQRLSRLYFAQVEENRRRAERVHRLFGTIALLNAERDTEKLLRAVTEAVRAHLGFRRVRLRLREPGASELKVRALAGPATEDLAEFDRDVVALEQFDAWLAASRRISESYLIGRNPVEAEEPAAAAKPASPAADGAAEPLEAWDWRDGERLVVPIRGRSGELAGCLSLDEPQDRLVPSRDGVELLEILAHNVGVAIDNNRLVAELEAQARDLEETHRRAQELHALKSTFLTGVSHEVRTSLGSVRAYVEGLR